MVQSPVASRLRIMFIFSRYVFTDHDYFGENLQIVRLFALQSYIFPLCDHSSCGSVTKDLRNFAICVSDS